jgi:predicted transcriptional regulator
MWDNVWEWLINHYIYNAAVSIGVITIIAYVFKRVFGSRFIHGILGRYKTIEVGKNGLKLEHKDEGNSEKDKQQDNALSVILSKLDQINQRLDRQYQYIREAAIKAGVSVVWSGVRAPFVEVIKAGLDNIRLGENGNLIKRIPKVIMEHGPGGIELFDSLLNDYIKESKEKGLILSDHFYAQIKAIKEKVH